MPARAALVAVGRRLPARAALAAVGLALLVSVGRAAPLADRPVRWYADDQRPIAAPAERDPSILWDYADDTFFLPLARLLEPGRTVRRLGSLGGGDHVSAAHNVNRLDEVPNSTWFTNRIGLYPLAPAAAAVGPGPGTGPDPAAPWTVVSAKTEGVTPGFNVRDAKGDVFVIKFDPPGFAGMTIGAGAISARLLHAAGYNVPDDVVVRFRRRDLVLGENVRIRDEHGKRSMTEADLDAILIGVDRSADGAYRAISSRFLSGRPIGPFDYKGRRKDDPNDRIAHQHRRELRGLKVFAAWLHHFDTKQHNSLDMFVEGGYVRHYLIDFASTLGSGAHGPFPRQGFEHTVDLGATLKRSFGLGFWEDPWRRASRPEGLAEVGYLESVEFDPGGMAPLQPNAAFVNCTDRDGYWAAKITSAFTDEHLRAICESARYEDPAATDYVAKTLGERRDAIARHWFDRVPPLDFFAWRGASLTCRDLGAERGIYPGATPRYALRLGRVAADRKTLAETAWLEVFEPRLDLSSGEAGRVVAAAAPGEFLRLECKVDRGGGFGGAVSAYFAVASRRVVAVER